MICFNQRLDVIVCGVNRLTMYYVIVRDLSEVIKLFFNK